jgi:PEP-CTERM/exosortase A-associated glycosyltransferase
VKFLDQRGRLAVPLRILHVLDHSLPLHSGYTFRTRAILAAQRARGWETFHLTGPKQGPTSALQDVADGWTFHRTPFRPQFGRMPVLGELILLRDLHARLDELAAELRPDIIHAHSPVLDALPALLVGRRYRIPVVYEVRAFWEDAAVSLGQSREGGLRYRATRALETFALRHADAVTTICEGLRGGIVKRGVAPEKITVIPNAVDLHEFAAPRPPDAALVTRHGLAGKTVVGFFGSFYHYEGLHLLLEAMPELTTKAPDLRVLLAGGGPQDKALRARAAELGLDGTVIFLGRVPHAEITKYYDLVDIMIYPRISIPLTELVTPLKPLEAMAMQKIVVASDVGGHRELIRDSDTGYLFAPDSPKALAAQLLDVLRSRPDWPAMRARGRRFVETERNWPGSVARYEGVYGSLLGR